MKKRLLQIGSFLMAFAVLFVSVGWDVKFHYCTEDHQLSGSFGPAVDYCLHCLDHEHEEADAYLWQHDALQFNAKCCCDDFDSKIQFTDNFVFSLEKQLIISLQSFILPHLDLNGVLVQVRQIFDNHSLRKTLKFLSGQERIVYFSSLKLNPLVF
jgi:hypothetical protein